MGKPTKMTDNRWYYRGFTIKRNFVSKHGTGQLCQSQQGYAIVPSFRGSSSGINGDWEPTIRDAVEYIDRLYQRHSEGTLRYEAARVVEEAIRLDQ